MMSSRPFRILGIQQVAVGGSDKQRDVYLPKIAAGETTMAFAHAEPQARYTLSDVKTMARKDGDGYILDGAKTLVLHGESADMFIVSARVNGAQRDTAGLALFIIDANTNGIARRGYTTTASISPRATTI